MAPSVFCACLIKVDEALQNLVGFDFPKLKVGIVKIMLETVDFDDIKVLDGKYSNATLLWIADLRGCELLSKLSLAEERFVYRTLISLYKV